MEQPTTPKITVFKKDAILELKFKVDFYQRLVFLLQYVVRGKTEEELLNAAEQMNKKEITEEWVAHYETLLYAVKGTEEFALGNGLLEEIDPADLTAPTEEAPQ